MIHEMEVSSSVQLHATAKLGILVRMRVTRFV